MRVISHELRAPLAVIRGYVSLLNTGAFGEMSEKAKETLAQMDENVVREIYLVHDFGFYLKLYFGEELKAEEEKFNLLEKVKSAVDLYSKEESKSGKAEFKVEGNETIEITTHAWLFSAAFSFILKNAVRGGNEGSKFEVTVSDNEGTILITVKDLNEKQEKVTEAFSEPQLAAGKRSGLELFIAAEAIKKLPYFEMGADPATEIGNTIFIKKSLSNS